MRQRRRMTGTSRGEGEREKRQTRNSPYLQGTGDTDESRGGVLDVEYVWRMWRTSYTPSGLLWGHSGFWYVISEIPVYLCVACCPCTLFQFEQAGHTVRRESGITSTGVQAQEGEPRRTPSDSSNISRTKLYDGKKLTRQRGRKWTEISFEGINPFIKQPVLFISNIRFTVYFAVKDGCSEDDFEKEREN